MVQPWTQIVRKKTTTNPARNVTLTQNQKSKIVKTQIIPKEDHQPEEGEDAPQSQG